MEQLRKVLQSLVEFYKDNKKSPAPFPLPNEAEFRAYYALVFLRDQDVSRQLETLPEDIFFSEPMMRSLNFRSLAQRSNDRFVQNNSEAAQNLFNRFFRNLKSSATYLEACILETWLGSIRTGALKALRQAFGGMKALQISQVSVDILVSMLGFDDTEQLVAFCNYLGLEVVSENGIPKAVWFKRNITWEG
jgi:SAC3/GANP family